MSKINSEFKKTWYKWINDIADKYRDDRHNFETRFTKIIKGSRDNKKAGNLINMFSILNAMDYLAIDIFDNDRIDYKYLVSLLQDYKDRHDSEV